MKTLLSSNITRILTLLLVLAAGLVVDNLDKDIYFGTEDPLISVLGSKADEETLDGPFTLTRVIDGDTIELAGNIKVRYIGIDTPEVDERKEVECFGLQATAENTRLLSTGNNKVWLEKDTSETDKYSRLLRYVYIKRIDNNIENYIMVNWELARTGYANAASFPPDVKYQDELRQAETEAREENLGLWSSCPS